jgi:hypothetical protein
LSLSIGAKLHRNKKGACEPAPTVNRPALTTDFNREDNMIKKFALAGILVSCLLSLPAAFADDAATPAHSDSCATGQDLTPIKQVGMYLDGYHTYRSEEKLSADKQKQIRTAHYCKQVNPDMFQCLIYDGNGPDAKCIGVEYVITEKLMKTLPAAEQKLWHNHDSEVDTGLLVLPGLPETKQKEILGVLRSTYGKTWQVWPDLTQSVPLGAPVLMWNVDPAKISTATKESVAVRKTNPSF